MLTKRELRKITLQKRDALSNKERQRKSCAITQKVIASKEFENAEKILLFVSYGSEVDTEEIMTHALKRGKEVYVPKVLGKNMEFYRIYSREDLEEGYRGILEPKEYANQFGLKERDLNVCILMPGAVFDTEGGRIGYGGGFYDRFLQQLETETKQGERMSITLSKIAVAYECQIVENGLIPKEEHDIAPDYIVTEERIILI